MSFNYTETEMAIINEIATSLRNGVINHGYPDYNKDDHDSHDEALECKECYVQVTLGATFNEDFELLEWDLQYGDNTFDGSVYDYEYWGVIPVMQDCQDFIAYAKELYEEVITQVRY